MLFVEHIIYPEKSRESIDKLGKVINELSKMTVYTVNEKRW